MSIVFDILHLAVAALLAIIGIGYEREEDCPPVRFEPAAQVEMVEADSDAIAPIPASGCERARPGARLPAL
jgi:hypothetical protein